MEAQESRPYLRLVQTNEKAPPKGVDLLTQDIKTVKEVFETAKFVAVVGFCLVRGLSHPIQQQNRTAEIYDFVTRKKIKP